MLCKVAVATEHGRWFTESWAILTGAFHAVCLYLLYLRDPQGIRQCQSNRNYQKSEPVYRCNLPKK